MTTVADSSQPSLVAFLQKKRPAEEDPNDAPAVKRVTPSKDDITSVLGPEEAEKILKNLKSPKPLKKQTIYGRFKNVMLRDAKKQKDQATIDNITAVAKDSWALVKSRDVNTFKFQDASEQKENETSPLQVKLDKYMRIKKAAEEEETAELASFEEEIAAFKGAFLPAALASLQYMAQTMTDAKAMEGELQDLNKSALLAWKDATRFPKELSDAFKAAQAKLTSLQQEGTVEALVKKLQGAPKEVLEQHAREFVSLMAASQKLQVIAAKSQALQAEQEKQEADAIANAYKIKSELCRELKKQMVYTNPSLKRSAKKISYKRSGVSVKEFAAAFNVPEGNKTVTLDGVCEIGLKSLRYGALGCNDVKVRLQGDTLTASTSYKII